DLLPASSPSVVELRRLMRETEQGGQICVLVDGAARDELRAAAGDIARRLQAAGEPRLTEASSGVHEARRCLSPRAGRFASGDLPGARSALDAVERSVNETLSKSEHAGVRARYAGDLVTGLAEFGATQRDLVDVGVLGLGMVLAVVLLHFMRLRVLLLMAVAI